MRQLTRLSVKARAINTAHERLSVREIFLDLSHRFNLKGARHATGSLEQ